METRNATQEPQDHPALSALLDADRIAVRPGFKTRVMEALPTASWQARSHAWMPLAAMVLTGLGAASLLSGAASESHLVATGAAIIDFMVATLMAGAGLFSASWRGAGMALEELFAGSGVSLVAFAAMVLCLDLLFVSLLRRRPVQAEATAEGGDAAAG